MAVIETLAATANQDPMSMPALAEVIDTDSLDAIFRRETGGPSTGAIRLSFSYLGYEVTVKHDGEVIVDPRQSSV